MHARCFLPRPAPEQRVFNMVALHGTLKLRAERAEEPRPAGPLPAVPLPPRQKKARRAKARKAPLEAKAPRRTRSKESDSSSSSAEPDHSSSGSIRTDTSVRAPCLKPAPRHRPLSSRPASAPATGGATARPLRSSTRPPLPRPPAPKAKRKKRAPQRSTQPPATPRPAEPPPEIDRCAEALQWLQAPG